MNPESLPDPVNPKTPIPQKSRLPLVLLLAISLGTLAVVILLLVAPRNPPNETVEEIVEGEAAGDLDVNRQQVTDARDGQPAVVEPGRRYRVLIEDESKDSAAGIARIGGRVTFVPATRKGEDVVVEVTRLKRTTAEAVVVRRMGHAKIPDRETVARPDRKESRLEPGAVFSGKVEDVGKKGDGIVRVNGKVVFIPGVARGEEVTFRIVEDQGRIARGERLAGDVPAAVPAGAPGPAGSGADAVQPGREFEVTVTEKDRKNPDVNGVARIEGLVVFVPGTQPGAKVRVRIVERKDRFARAEVLPVREAPASAE
jgi:predicted RNA-binding protein with TRAM domain